MIVVIDEATSQDLATLASVKAALGITDTSEDGTLPPLISQASAAIASFCNRVLVQETVDEFFRSNGRSDCFLLERYPVISVTSIGEAGIILVAADYEADLSAGTVSRLRSDRFACWANGTTVIRYVGGYELADMPPDIVQALILLVLHYRSGAGRDPLLRAVELTDISRREYFIPTAGGLPPTVEALLINHRKPAGA